MRICGMSVDAGTQIQRSNVLSSKGCHGAEMFHMHEVPAYVHLGCHNSTFTFPQPVLVGEDVLEVIRRREEGREVGTWEE